MEDLTTYTDFRKQLIDGVCSLEAVKKLARGIGKVHNQSHLAKVGEQSFSQLKQKFPWVCIIYAWGLELAGVWQNSLFL